ncbi:hypothetical protein BH11PSE13_BH11PSE13_12110 [soil metagenome]
MTSPVDTSVKHYRNDMVGAPVLTGAAGSLIALLDACLINGFDSKTLTSLVALAGVMTATFSGTHSATVDSVVLLAGVTGGPSGFAGANGEQKVTARPTATTVSWATVLPDGTYTGTITMKMAPVPYWSKAFTGTNLAAYRSTHPDSTGMYLYVDDTNTTVARVVGYESMTAINAGVNAWPTTAIQSGGGYWVKSAAANTSPINWTLIADSRAFAFHCAPYQGNGVPTYNNMLGGATYFFGDFVSLRPGGNPWDCVLSFKYTPSTTDATLGDIASSVTWNNGICMPRPASGFGGANVCNAFPYQGTYASMSGLANINFYDKGALPTQSDGAIRLCKRYITMAGYVNMAPRGDVPGLWHCPQYPIYDVLQHRSILPGSGALAGRNLIGIAAQAVNNSIAVDTTNTGLAFWDITGPWRN